MSTEHADSSSCTRQSPCYQTLLQSACCHWCLRPSRLKKTTPTKKSCLYCTTHKVCSLLIGIYMSLIMSMSTEYMQIQAPLLLMAKLLISRSTHSLSKVFVKALCWSSITSLYFRKLTNLFPPRKTKHQSCAPKKNC